MNLVLALKVLLATTDVLDRRLLVYYAYLVTVRLLLNGHRFTFQLHSSFLLRLFMRWSQNIDKLRAELKLVRSKRVELESSISQTLEELKQFEEAQAQSAENIQPPVQVE